MADARGLLVIGATGQVGGRIVSRAVGRGIPVVGLRRQATPPDSMAGVTWLSHDLADRPIDLTTYRVKTAIHATGLWLLPKHVDALAAAGVRRLVAFSSSSIVGKANSRSAYENDQIAAIADAEGQVCDACAARRIEWTMFRPTLTYGTGQDLNVSAAARFIDRFGWYPVSGRADGLRQPVHADDLAAAALDVLDCAAGTGQTYYLCGGETLTYREMIGRLFDCLHRARRLVPVPGLPTLVGTWGWLRANPFMTADSVRRMNIDLAFDDGRARRDFGYAPRRFLAGGRADLGIGLPDA